MCCLLWIGVASYKFQQDVGVSEENYKDWSWLDENIGEAFKTKLDFEIHGFTVLKNMVGSFREWDSQKNAGRLAVVGKGLQDILYLTDNVATIEYTKLEDALCKCSRDIKFSELECAPP